MPHNAVIDVSFSDEQSSTSGLGTASVLTYTAIGGEYFFQDDRLIGATVFLVFRDGLVYMLIDDLLTFTGNKECKFDNVTGTITFPPAPFPAMEAGEIATVLYATGDLTIIITEPVTLAEAKAWCKVEVTDDDILITALITSARQMCEGYVSQSFVQRTVTAVIRNDLGGQRLPYGPVGEVVSITDSSGSAIDVMADMFTGIKFLSLNYGNGGGLWDPKRNTDLLWQQTDNIFTLVYTAGYSTLPKNFKTAVLMQICWQYYNRGDEIKSTSFSPDMQMILRPYRSIT